MLTKGIYLLFAFAAQTQSILYCHKKAFMNKTKKKKTKKWIKTRHRIVQHFVMPIFYVWSKISYGLKIQRLKKRDKRQYLIICNHQTAFDQFFVSLLLKRTIFYVASEDIFCKGFVSKLLSRYIAPIPIKKSVTDIRAIMNILKVKNEGGTIAIFPEGNRTYSGETGYIKPGIVSLIKKLGLPLLVLRIEGGYGVEPRWAKKQRKGTTYIRALEVVEKEDYQKLSDSELEKFVADKLYHSEAKVTESYKSNARAEYLDRAMYVCPYCGISRLNASGNVIKCTKCGRETEYLETKQLKGVGFDFPFEFVADWYKYQCDFIAKTDLLAHLSQPIWQETATVWDTKMFKMPKPIFENANISLFGDRYVISSSTGELTISFSDVTAVTALGKNKLNIYVGDMIYQLKSDCHFNPLIFMNVYYVFVNANKKEEQNELACKQSGKSNQFLGI